jgi:HTH domain
MRCATRPPILRMIRIDLTIGRGKFPNTVSLSRELEVSRRAVRRDVEFMHDQLDEPIVPAHGQGRTGGRVLVGQRVQQELMLRTKLFS